VVDKVVVLADELDKLDNEVHGQEDRGGGELGVCLCDGVALRIWREAVATTLIVSCALVLEEHPHRETGGGCMTPLGRAVLVKRAILNGKTLNLEV